MAAERCGGQRANISWRSASRARNRRLFTVPRLTPVISLIRTALSCEPGSEFTLLYGNRDSASVIFLDALADLKAEAELLRHADDLLAALE